MAQAPGQVEPQEDSRFAVQDVGFSVGDLEFRDVQRVRLGFKAQATLRETIRNKLEFLKEAALQGCDPNDRTSLRLTSTQEICLAFWNGWATEC